MKRFERGVLLFLVLILALSSGSSYLSLHQAAKTSKDENNEKMTVALVNEDEGADFDGETYDFGTEFIDSIEKDDTHHWYVVSRGVAESGLKNNVYNMMVIIPNDFTQRALSIHSKTPEKVMLNYKINASGSDNVREKAEKTANTILGDINRRIIDVYFASVIGNLQEAQDHISTLVKKEKVYTSNYTNEIYRPLANYSSQFKEIQSYTNVSKERLKQLDQLLNEFETDLVQGANTNQTLYSTFSDFSNKKTANGLLVTNFSNELSQYNQELNNNDVSQQLQKLGLANDAVTAQFQSNEKNTTNILSVSAAVQSYLSSAKNKMDQLDIEIADRIIKERQQVIAAEIKKEIENGSGSDKTAYLKNIFAQMDRNAQQKIQKQMDKLPSLSLGDIDELYLKHETTTELKNVIAVTNKYSNEFGYIPNISSNSTPLTELVKDIKNSLVEKGVTLSDTLTLSEAKEAGQIISLTIPSEFKLNQVLLTLPNSQEKDYTETYLNNGKITLPATSKGTITLKINSVLKSSNSKLDIFQPVTWNWRISQKDIKETESIKKQAENVEEGELPVNQSARSEDNNNVEIEVDQNNKETNPIQSVVVKNTVVANDFIEHQVMSPLSNHSTDVLVNAASDSVSNYQKLSMLFHIYFGIDMSSPVLVNSLNTRRLSDLATNESFYYLFKKQDIVDFLTNFAVEQITEEVRKQAGNLKTDMKEYIKLVNDANESSKQLSLIITNTTKEAEELNKNLSATLINLASWREKSLELQENHLNIISNENEEKGFIVSLDSEFHTWLSTSQSLAAMSKSNVNSANDVYETFDAIHHQANEIQNSGMTLVKEANNLSVNLTEKWTDDQKFADNFADVLANSRIGERQNESLYSFLSNPVETKNAGVIFRGDSTIPYFMVLICFIVSLFTAYTISTNEWRRSNKDSFEKEKTVVAKNTPIAIITVSIGIVEGLLIGILSGYLLHISQGRFILWIGLIMLIMLAQLLVATYLLRQLKMLGMFVLLMLLSLYLFLTGAVGISFDQLSLGAKIRSFSPLEYVERLLLGFSNGEEPNMVIILSLIVTVAISFVGQLFVINRSTKGEVIEAEETSEAH